jgi:hypothetical protein
VGAAVAVLAVPPAVRRQLAVPVVAISESTLYAAVPSQARGKRIAVGFIDPVGDPRTVLVTLGSDRSEP